jgi:DNA-binding transcriptional LysR family regulator
MPVRATATSRNSVSGEVRIACPEAMTAILAPVLGPFLRRHPDTVVRIDELNTRTTDVRGLRERKFDLLLLRLSSPLPEHGLTDDLDIDILFEDALVLAAGRSSRWARRRKIDLAELIKERWILPGRDSGNYRILSKAFAARGLSPPPISLVTYSVHLRTRMVVAGGFVTMLPESVVRINGKALGLKTLPVDLGVPPWPVAIVTSRKRAPSPLAARFIAHLREVMGADFPVAQTQDLHKI